MTTTTAQEIAQALRNELPADLHAHLPRLAEVLASVIDKTLTADAARQHLNDSAFESLLQALTGKEILFDAGDGNIKVGDISRGEGIAIGHGATVINIHLHPVAHHEQPIGIKRYFILNRFMFFLLVIVIILALVVSRVDSLHPIVKDMWQWLSPPFRPAKKGESLIIVANFINNSVGTYDGVNPDEYIYHALRTHIQHDRLQGIRVERLYELLDANTVRQAGKSHNATLVVWGQYDAVGITPYVERIKAISTARTDEEGTSILIDPKRIQFSVVTDLPVMSTYLVLLTLGADFYVNEQPNEAIKYLTSAIDAIPEDEVTARPDEAYFLRGITHYYTEDYQQAVLDYTQAISLEYEPLLWPYVNRGNAYAHMNQYEQAMTDYNKAIELEPRDPSGYNQICWWGSLAGRAADTDVKAACERAVTLAPDNGGIRDTRGVNRALNGDFAGALEDFRAYVKWAKERDSADEDFRASVARREAWIVALEAGENPFNEETLAALRNE